MSSEQKPVKRTSIKVPEFTVGEGSDGIKVAIEAQHMKNFKSVILFIKLGVKDAKSDSTSVLNGLIRQYARIHDMGVGISTKTNIMSIIPGAQSIYIMTDEHHILPNIKLFYKYILEKKLDSVSTVIKQSTNYESVKASIVSMNVIVYGKCQGFIKKFPAQGEKTDKITPITSLQTGLVVNKPTAGAINVNKVDCPEIAINTQDVQARLMVAIILASVPFTFDANNIRFNCAADAECAKKLLRDRKANIVVLKRFVEQMKPTFDKDTPTADFVNRFRMFARIMFNLKGCNNDCSVETVKLFIDSCKGRTNTIITNLAKVQ